MVANPVKGEVPFEASGQTYTLLYDFNAICAVEEVFDLPITEIGKKMADGMRAGDLRKLIAAGLQQHHPGVSDLQAGEIIGAIGAQVAAEKLAEAMQAAFPQAWGDASGKARPQTRRQAG
jgi:hypothetical protein